ncbi:histidine phosphatase family protein [Candidatus Thiodiazotropha sp. CDECU1]|uniref:histidine phosphatase family protein n=1 Tax=Candidatus Thiodiazotropha sp. CDECU1 TaxID=3065865 RepID=UPI00292D3325|nr:histidine phosphatase family protein [Candidatus Thiodiazotropha sp. CDECU1]
MHITILRHGKPDFEWQRTVKGSEFRSLEHAYDTAGIVGNPPEESLDLVNQHKCIVCSDLPRSLQSAKALGADSIHFSSAAFREMNLPYFDNVQIKLPLNYWVLLLRSLWFLGFSKNTESISIAKTRAKKASEKLIELANEHHSVLFVGHGFLNHFVAKELRGNNWLGPRSPGKKYWDYGTYEYI